MNKLPMQTPNLADENFAKLQALFPNAVTEVISGYDDAGKAIVTRAIDKDVLMQEISAEVVDGPRERYQFTWPDKKKSVLLANAPIQKTLRPCREESVDFDHTENLYIEGDNLDVLKLLRETYLGKIKMIYIDPPYNTGNDFVYEDDFAISMEEYTERSHAYDEEGNRLVKNLDSNGRFHTDWLNMIYPRLKLARDLLTDDGVVFVSIDDSEVENLKKVCGELFGQSNFIAQVVWERAFSPVNLKKHFSESHDYILCYAKNKELSVCNGLPRSTEANDRYNNPDNDPRGPWTSGDLSVGPRVESRVYKITVPSGRVILPPSGYCWRLDQKTYEAYVKDNRIWFGDGNNVPRIKRFLSEVKEGITPMTIWKYTDVGHSQDATKRLKDLFDGKAYFDYPKPINLIKRCLHLYSSKDCYVLDFFSGSATTAHAVMQLNAEDGGKRKFIMVQLPEETDEKSEAFKAGYKNICEIGKERIRRAGAKIKEEAGLTAANLDVGFRVLKLDSTNMKPVYYKPSDYMPSLFDSLTDNIKEDRTPEDLLFQVMLERGVLPSSSIEEKTIGGKRVFFVAGNYLVACFDSDLDEATITAIAKTEPYYFVTRESAFSSDSAKTNCEQLFKVYSQGTEWWVM